MIELSCSWVGLGPTLVLGQCLLPDWMSLAPFSHSLFVETFEETFENARWRKVKFAPRLDDRVSLPFHTPSMWRHLKTHSVENISHIDQL